MRVMTKMRNEYEDYSPFFVKPHTLIVLSMLVCLLYLMANTDLIIDQQEALLLDPEVIVPSKTTVGAIKAVAILFVGIGAIHLPNTIMTRPISFVWRVLLALLILYILLMTFILMLPRQ